jgi:hypothetical protein
MLQTAFCSSLGLRGAKPTLFVGAISRTCPHVVKRATIDRSLLRCNTNVGESKR